MVEDLGFSVQQAAWIFTVYTAVSMVFQMLGGYVGDRIPKNVALFIFTGVQAGAVVLLALATSLFDFYLFAIILPRRKMSGGCEPPRYRPNPKPVRLANAGRRGGFSSL